MTDFELLAIHSDSNGDPGGDVGHVVLVCPTGITGVVPVNEFTDDGKYTHADCAPAALSTFLNYCKIPNDVREIETLAGTGPSGTLFPGIITAAKHYGINAVFSDQNPPPGPIANPAGGRMIDQAAFYDYLASTQGGCVILPVPSIAPAPPTAPPVGDTDMARLVTAGIRPATEGQDPHGQGAVYLTNEFVKRWIPSPAVEAQFTPTYGKVQTINAYVLDSIPEMPDVSKRVELAADLFTPVTLPDTE